MISVSFYCDVDSPVRFHRDCSGAGSWIGRSERFYAFDPPADMINDLIRHKNDFWCHHCGRGLFFPSTCIQHADTVVFEGAQGVEEGEEEEELVEDFVS